ncbi:chondroitin AC/alginate lyase [Russula brevipes]|nr:chondroitin AC/alginate lyase [Russula brevipes]
MATLIPVSPLGHVMSHGRLKCSALKRLPYPPSSLRSVNFRRTTPGSAVALISKYKQQQTSELFDPTYPGAHLPSSQRQSLAPRWVNRHLTLYAFPKAFLTKPDAPHLKPHELRPYPTPPMRPGQRSVDMSMQVVAFHSRVVAQPTVRSKIRRRLKEAVRLIVTRGAAVEASRRGPKVVFRAGDVGADKWIVPDWTYVAVPTTEMLRMPFAEQVDLMRKGLGFLHGRIPEVEAIFRRSHRQNATWLLSPCPPALSFRRLVIRYHHDDLNVDFSSYDNDFIPPDYILAKKWNETTVVAQGSIIQWADYLAAQGPWSVTTSKPFLAPSNDTHDYLSWAPYYWPNCTGVGNTTELTPQQIWVTCPYQQLDGQFNPDIRTVNNTGAFNALADATIYNALAWVINGSSQYSKNVANWIDTWFLANATYMNPNLNYAQVVRGPKTSNKGSHTGVLDLKCMVKIVNALALAEAAATNNHGSYYYGQLAALQILVNDIAGANATIQKYFSTLYMGQINATGEQPLEAVRTRPFHYRAYNLEAMITNARLATHVGFDAWHLRTSDNGTIKAALDFTMTVPPNDEDATELFPSVGAIAAQFGDPDGTYAGFLARSQANYPADPWFFWDVLGDSGWVKAHANGPGASTANATGSRGSGTGKNGARARDLLGSGGRLFLGAAIAASLHAFWFI